MKELKQNLDWADKRFLHVPTQKVYKLNGAGGIVWDVDRFSADAGGASLPLWLTENSKDFVEIKK